MLKHLTPEKIVQMPLHMQILYYLEKWGKLAQDCEVAEESCYKLKMMNL